MKRQIMTIGIALLIGACGVQAPDPISTSTQVSQRDQLGDKADGFINTALSCADSCGLVVSDVSGYCGCDEECQDFGDCCANQAAICDAVSTGKVIIDQSQNGKEITAELGVTIDIQLAGNATTGYAWKLLRNSRSFPLQKEEYIPNSPMQTGSGGTYHFYYVADMFAVGNSHTLDFAYYRSWEGSENAAKTFTVTIKVLPSEAECLAIDKMYMDTLIPARVCGVDTDCDAFISGKLTCWMGNVAFNSSNNKDDVEAARSKWSMSKCEQVKWVCPLLSPLPPWFEISAKCEHLNASAPGLCMVEYIDSRTP